MRSPVAFIAVAALSSCAALPEDIAPLYTSEVPYLQYTCEQLETELFNLNSGISVASQQQSRTRNADALGIYLVGLPVGSMSGRGAEVSVATLKGHYQAAERAIAKKGCRPKRA